MIIPAIDLIEGEVVRLYQGDYQQKTAYRMSPLEALNRYADDGAQWLHIVDLTGAKDTTKRQLSLIKQMTATNRMKFQAGGGVRTQYDVEQLLQSGVDRVVIGSLAVKQPEKVKSWLKRYGSEQIVLALDINIDEQNRKWLAVNGWEKNSGIHLESLLNSYLDAGIKHVLCTDISRDGTLSGSNIELYTQLSRQYPSIEWQASGGIGSLQDIEALKPAKVAGVILGKALLEGNFAVKEAIECWQNASSLA
ncbi:1-(5-phosphoribosyl)-5-[(5-phosphoribosylamino)methylideneamino]imidazole-4-carboxamide isomerase [Alteromonas sp. ASW11-130]|uniref:1-(5-phosphoribosyl)-5-[(5- phosphoribosylamino)methylideneamino]imidazole-4- carboxamide isomerase n=1 Tax=Alteromonas sp. ASW11-130 TaxID=3015775 RepID=UPI002242512D|nr:1-(5-phosphoribosyl)-5-[(5-phosphoribosylamino)methylideneamino]imidazole-4-carboxamide isomerase [Alteromonas sp. ASW11-130]MCW8092522.1 1-(5-phosphoribosyl)-5-[(5-phosphoribosylamino)methylideneamino]imidazole-4-carboxamide isomerase [Alteromonas sp. ASW11-130]